MAANTMFSKYLVSSTELIIKGNLATIRDSRADVLSIFSPSPGQILFALTKKLMLYMPFLEYPEEERPCLSKYWKIYFPDREISLALFLDYFLYNFFAD